MGEVKGVRIQPRTRFQLEADVLIHLGEAERTAGDRDAAHCAWQRALELLRGLSQETSRIRALLDQLDQRDEPGH
jgi:hypothetical protein